MSVVEHPAGHEFSLRVGLEAAGISMTPQEFDAIEDYDEGYGTWRSRILGHRPL
jgi:hypothetical protein